MGNADKLKTNTVTQTSEYNPTTTVTHEIKTVRVDTAQRNTRSTSTPSLFIFLPSSLFPDTVLLYTDYNISTFQCLIFFTIPLVHFSNQFLSSALNAHGLSCIMEASLSNLGTLYSAKCVSKWLASKQGSSSQRIHQVRGGGKSAHSSIEFGQSQSTVQISDCYY